MKKILLSLLCVIWGVLVVFSQTSVLPLSFEYNWTGFGSSTFGEIPANMDTNPNASGINTSSRVVKIHKTAGAQIWAGASLDLTAGIDFTSGTMMKVKVYSPRANVTIRFKLEASASGPAGSRTDFVEVDATVNSANTWEELTFDLTNPAVGSYNPASTYDVVVLFPDFGNGGADEMFFFDDIMVMGTSLPTKFTGSVVVPLSFEYNWAGFGSSTFGEIPANMDANPNASGINTSSSVVKIHKTAGAQIWAGASLDLTAGIDFTSGTMMKVKAYSPRPNVTIRFKLEASASGPAGSRTDFVEVDATLSSANTWEELTFDLTNPATGSYNPASTYDVVVLFPDFGNVGGDEMFFFDDIMVMPAPSVNTVDFPLDFQCPHINYTFGDFEGAGTQLADNPVTNGINTSTRVASSVKGNGAATFAGTVITLEDPIDFSLGTVFKLKVLSPKAGATVRLKLENISNTASFDEIDATTTQANAWEELTFDFSSTTASTKSLQKAIIFFDFGNPGDGSVYCFDDLLQMGNSADSNCQAPTTPPVAATVPAACDTVISIFSDTYMDRAGTNLNPNFGQITQFSAESISGNNVMKLSNFNFQGNALAGPPYVDAMAMTHLHVDYWTPDLTNFRIKLVDAGINQTLENGGGDDSEGEVSFTVTRTGEWVSLDIPLTDFAAQGLSARNNIAQIIYSTLNPGGTVFIDNVYFYGDCNMTVACPTMPVWQDEFNGTSLNTADWQPQLGDGTSEGIPGWGNNELQYYKAENATVANGVLTITANREDVAANGQTFNYTSARLRTKDMQDFTYGRFEARIKLPVGQGIWPAFWMLSTDEVYGIWPLSGEIDIMEYLGQETDNIFGTIHYGDLVPNNRSSSGNFRLNSGGFNDDFHVFAIEWDENVIRWYIDDILYFTRTPTDISPDFWPFNQRFHLLLNMAVGGNLPGNPDASTVFPQKMEVDYVRVYNSHFPYITGSTGVANQATNQVYTVGNAASGSNFNWTVPPGATIISGQGTSSITVNWGDETSSGDVSVAISSTSCSALDRTLTMNVKVDIAKVSVLECVLENFDSDSLITLINSNERGTLTEDVANPDPNNAVNNSALVARYTRSANQFDNIQYSTAVITDGARFVNGTKKLFIDVYTTAPTGTSVLVQLENAAKSAGAFPAGRHSRYEAFTTVQNAWERLELKFKDRPDGATTDTEIDKLTLLFDAGTVEAKGTPNTYYFDNFDKFCNDQAQNCFEDMNFSLSDPCSCDNPLNVTLLDGSILFEDTLKVDANMIAAPHTVRLASQDGNLLNASGTPIPANTSFLDLGGGMFGLQFYTRSNTPSTVTVEVNGIQRDFTTTSCSPCTPIPTMSEWGLIIFGLLMLNLGVFFIRRKEDVLSR